MPDLDEFEPTAKQWKSALEDFASNQERTSDEIAEEAFHQVMRMLHVWKGCPFLMPITNLLWSHRNALLSDIQTERDIRHDTLVAIHTKLGEWAKAAPDERLHIVMLRSANAVALHMSFKHFYPETAAELQHYVVVTMVQDLIRHCFLDKARAFAVGKRVKTGHEAHRLATNVLSSLEKEVSKIASELIERPDASSLDVS